MLTKTRYLWLKNPLNGTDCPRERFQAITVDALKVGRAFAIQEAFSDFWDYRYTVSAHQFFDRGFLGGPLATPAYHGLREDPQTSSAGVTRLYKTSHTRAAAEGMNAQIPLLKANACGYRNFTPYRIAPSSLAGSLTSSQRGARHEAFRGTPHETWKSRLYSGDASCFNAVIIAHKVLSCLFRGPRHDDPASPRGR